MKRFRPLFSALALSVSVNTAVAATAFEGDVPAEVVEQVVGAMFGGQLRLYSDLPDDFPPFDMPRDMTLLASVDQGYSQRVILKSQFDPQAATALAYGALLDAGWDLIPMPGMQQPQTGFINPYQPVPQTQLCHDEHGMMQVSAQMGSGITYVNMMRAITPPGMPVQMQGCTPVQVDPPMPEPYRLLQEQMPRLQLPNTGGMSASGGYGGGGGGPNEWETRANVNGPWDLERVFEFFAEQVEEQGWVEDAQVLGAHMASGSWTKTVEDVELVGSLIVMPTDTNNYDLRFRLVRKGALNVGGIGMDRVIRSTVIGPPLNAPALGIRGIPAGARIVPMGGTFAPIGSSEIVRD